MKKILLDIKPFQETLNADMCGPTSLKIVLEYYGVSKSEDELAKMAGIKRAYMKKGSPSCGVGGITRKMLEEAGITVHLL